MIINQRPALPAGTMILVLVTALAVILPGRAASGVETTEVGVCWTIRPIEGPRLRCRDSRGELVDHPSPRTVGFDRFPAEGRDIWGRCWHDDAVATGFEVEGDWFAEYGYVVGSSGAGPARAVVRGERIRRCRAEPAASGYASLAMSLASGTELRPEVPVMAPSRGVVGLESVVSPVAVSGESWIVGFPEFDESLSLRIEPSRLRFVWGDGSSAITGSEPRSVLHSYMRSGRYTIGVEIEWTGWWSVGWDPGWREFSVGPMFVVVEYDVDEIVVRLVRS